MNIRILLLACTLFVELFLYKFWFICHSLGDRLHFSAFDSDLKLHEFISNDVGYNTTLVRFFHNKLGVYLIQFFNQYVTFWDIRFDRMLFSLIGCFGIGYAIWFVLTKKKKTPITIAGILFFLLLPLIEVFQFHIPYPIRFIIILLPFTLLSLFGIWQFLSIHKKRGNYIIIILLLISLWYGIVLQNDIKIFCLVG